MKINRFKIIVTARTLLLGGAIFIFLYMMPKPGYYMLKIGLAAATVYLLFGLIHFVEKTNRQLNRFLQSIQYDDFTQSFSSESLGKASDDLRKSFNQITQQFLELRSEKEEHARYLQTVIKHVGVGLISFKSDGEVQLINQAAIRLLNINHLKNIRGLEQFSKPLVNTLLNLKTGEHGSIKIDSNGITMHLSVYATQFIIKDERYTLVSIQDIQAEIEREHMAKELEIAWNVQKSLLPSGNPNLPGFDIAGMCQPAKEVGGDYYDFIPLGNSKLAMIIGDVSGKGTSASFYMTLTKGFIQSHMLENASPKDVLVKVNELMVNTVDRRTFVTIFIAVLDWKTRKITCARAGHNPAIHYSQKNKECFSIKPGGIALGFRKNGSFTEIIEEHQFQMDKDDWLILYTDGFTESMDKNSQLFGEDRFLQSVKQNHNKNAQEMVNSLFKEIQTFSHPMDQYDDMTIIAVKG